MFIGANDILAKEETTFQITKEDFDRIEKNQKIIMAMIVALALLTLLKK